jgi:hypothetical protein
MSELNWGAPAPESVGAFVQTVKITEAVQSQYGGLNCTYQKTITKKDGEQIELKGWVTIPISTYSNGGMSQPTKDFLQTVGLSDHDYAQSVIDSILNSSPDWQALINISIAKNIKVVEYLANTHNANGYPNRKTWSGYKPFSVKENIFSTKTDDKVILGAFLANPPKNYDPKATKIENSSNEATNNVADDIFN